MGAFHSQLIELMGAMGIREARRLRGEVGRAMLFEDLEKMSFAPIFGERVTEYEPAPAPAGPGAGPGRVRQPGLGDLTQAPSRYRNALTKFKVERLTTCVACGKCAETCQFGVHLSKAATRCWPPSSSKCRGADYCRSIDSFCGDACPVGGHQSGN